MQGVAHCVAQCEAQCEAHLIEMVDGGAAGALGGLEGRGVAIVVRLRRLVGAVGDLARRCDTKHDFRLNSRKRTDCVSLICLIQL